MEYCIVENSNDHGIEIVESLPAINNCTIRNNPSAGSGGGLYITKTSGDISFKGCNISNNVATNSHGGGIFANMGTGTLRMLDCVIDDNMTTTSSGSSYYNLVGGGVYILGNAEFIRCPISNISTYSNQFSEPVSRGGGSIACQVQ
jgi:hypothetical protein